MRQPGPLRVLWAPYAQRGSLYPIVPVARSLVSLGAEMTLLGLPGLETLAGALGVGFTSYQSGVSYDWSRPDGRDKHGLGSAAGVDWFHDRVRTEYAEVERAIRVFRPDVVLADSFVIGAGLAAEASGVPWASYVHYLFDEGAETDAMHLIWWEDRNRPETEAYAEWWDGVRSAAGLGHEQRDMGEAPWFRMSPLCTLLAGHPQLRRGARPLPGYVSRTSFTPWDEAGEAAPEIIARTSLPRVLVSNSSAWQDDAALLHSTVTGLMELEVEVVMTVSAEHDLRLPLPRNATVLGYHPHTSLLPTVDAVLTTGGYGLTSKALWFGRPLVVAPRARDQHYVAAAVEAIGCGLQLAWPPEPDPVAAAVAHVLASQEIWDQAQNLSGPQPGHPSEAEAAEMVLSLADRP